MNKCSERLRYLRKIKEQDEVKEYFREQARLKDAALIRQIFNSDDFGDNEDEVK